MANGPYAFRVPCPSCGVYMLWLTTDGACQTCGTQIVPNTNPDNLSTALRGGTASAWGGRAQVISRLHEGVIRTCTGVLIDWGKLGYVSRSFMDQMESWLDAQPDVSLWETATAREYEKRWLLPGMKEARKVILDLKRNGEIGELFDVQPIGAKSSDAEKANAVATSAYDELLKSLGMGTVRPPKSTNGVNDPLKHLPIVDPLGRPMLVFPMPTPMVTKGKYPTTKLVKTGWPNEAPKRPKEPTIEEKIDQAPKRARLELD